MDRRSRGLADLGVAMSQIILSRRIRSEAQPCASVGAERHLFREAESG